MTELGWTSATWDAAHPVLATTPAPTRLLLAQGASGHGESSGSSPARGLQAAATVTMTSTVTTTTTTTYVPPSEFTCYQDLTERQQDAVRTLGYSISKWHACKNPSCRWPAGIPRPDAACRDHTLYLAAKYSNNISWFDFTPLTQDALMLLGWSPSRWQDSTKPTTFARRWSDLFPREREAALFLGYQRRVWDGCVSETPCLERLERLENQMRGWEWTTMPLGIRDRLEELGWTRPTWAEGEQPASYRLDWMDLPYEQQVVARLLGYTSDVWNLCPAAECLPRFKYIQRRFNREWDDMKAAEQRAWMLLQHSSELWAQRGMTGTRAMQARWEELTPDQQAQASFLGHNKETWQGCNTDWTGPPVSNTSNVTREEPSISRTVRMRMVITRPFSEISGNVHGNQVAQMPTSFIMIFQRAVGRALFCGNPPLSTDPNTYVDVDGSPLCILRDDFERQKSRVQVMTVTEGSIIVDFIFVGNQTARDETAPGLFEVIKRQLESSSSPLSQDMEFGRYARAATIEEIPLSHLSVDERQQALAFETKRGVYHNGNACQLYIDTRNGVNPCPASVSGCSARPGAALVHLLAAAVALAAMVGGGAAQGRR